MLPNKSHVNLIQYMCITLDPTCKRIFVSLLYTIYFLYIENIDKIIKIFSFCFVFIFFLKNYLLIQNLHPLWKNIGIISIYYKKYLINYNELIDPPFGGNTNGARNVVPGLDGLF